MDAVELMLIRHGRTHLNAQRRFMGRTDPPLDTVGLTQAAGLAAHPDLREVGAVYASPLRRARQTAAALGREVVIVPDLAELDQGALEGRTIEEAVAAHPDFFQAWMRDPTGVRVPDGESLDAAGERAWRALSGIAGRHEPGERIAVVAHQLVWSAVAAKMAARSLASWREFALKHTAWHVVHWPKQGTPMLVGAP